MLRRRDEEARLNELEEYITRIYDDLYKNNYLVKYRLWQYNNATNQLLYKELLKNKTKKKNFHPLVSIIIPAYNAENYLAEAISSAKAQTYDNIEIIVVNDGSKDNTVDVAKKFEKDIRYFEKTNGGVSSALNYGIGKMKGDYFAWLSHDDLIAPKHIENLVEWVSYKENDQDIPFSSFRIVDENGHINLIDTLTSQFHCNDFKISLISNELSLLQGEINGGSVLIPKQAFKECGLFDESLRVAQERDMWSRLIKKYHFINIPFDTASIRTHSKRVTNTNHNIEKETNDKTMEIIDQINEQTKIDLFGDEISFYENMKFYYETHNKTFLMKKMEEEISELKNGNET